MESGCNGGNRTEYCEFKTFVETHKAICGDACQFVCQVDIASWLAGGDPNPTITTLLGCPTTDTTQQRQFAKPSRALPLVELPSATPV